MGVITREVFLKGNLFRMGEEAGVPGREKAPEMRAAAQKAGVLPSPR